MVKVTFTLDQDTVEQLRRAAARLARPQSQVVREAIREYAERVGKLSEQERRRLLQVFDTVVPAIPSRPLAQLREGRRRGGRRHPVPAR
ncbi:MAG: ribbon-helix-helix protein, CopG family [Candidatus Rokubacteria bacterium]|nr:ribbon-helix-helix protein, CopG family [Candidatus Rokubacteria bacterium]